MELPRIDLCGGEIPIPDSRLSILIVSGLQPRKQTASVCPCISLFCNFLQRQSLVIEVVSPGQENRDRDYRYKRTEYAARGIAEYWIVDPEMQQVTLCLWVNGQYEDMIYTGDTPIKSTMIPSFDLSATQILAFGKN